MKVFEKAYVIILKENIPSKDERIKEMLSVLDIPWEYHYAFNGEKELSDEDIKNYTLGPGARRGSSERVPMKKGEYGCVRSHVDVAKRARDENLSGYLVLEEDTLISPDFRERLVTIEKEMPEDTDMIFPGVNYLGPRLNPGSDRHTTRMLPPIKHRKTEHLWDFSTIKHFGTFAILIKAQSYDKIIELWEHYDNIADLQVYNAGRREELKILNLVPTCTYKKDGQSFINNRTRDYHNTRSLYSPSPDIENAIGIRKLIKEGKIIKNKYEVHWNGNWSQQKGLF